MRLKDLARLVILSLASLSAMTSAEVPEELLTSPIAAAFGASPTIGSPRLSPDGAQMTFVQQNENGLSLLYSLDFMTDASPRLVLGEMDPLDIVWCEWANQTRLLCQLREIVGEVAAERQNFSYMAIDHDGSDAQEVLVPCGDNIDWLPEEDEYILSVCGNSAHRVHLYSRQVISEDPGRSGSDVLVTDGHGDIRLAKHSQSTARWYTREDVESEDWIAFHESNRQEFEEPFRPVGFGANLDEVFHIASESGRWALFVKSLLNDFEDRLVFSHPAVDVELVDTLGPYDRVVAAAFLQDTPRRAILDERVAGIYQAMTELLPGQSIEIIQESWDSNVYLARAIPDDRSTGVIYRLDVEDAVLEAVGSDNAHLEDLELAPTQTILLQGSDSGSFSAHLTVPLGADRPIPMVIIPRALPSRLNIADPHYLVQFLAASGYGVLRVDYRGPEEFGGVWLQDRAVVGWEQTVSDIRDAAEFLVESGITERGRICALGRNLGAYAAVMTAIEYPQTLNCIVSIEGLLDPREFSSSVYPRVSQMLNMASPVQRAEDMERPALLIDDQFFTHSGSLYDALRGADKEVEFVQYEENDPGITRTTLRIDMLTRIAAYLDLHTS